jgi:hypothetical protein
MEIDGHLDGPVQNLLSFRLWRNLGIRASRLGSCRISRAGRPDGDIASRYAVFLDEVLDGQLGAASSIELSDDGGAHSCHSRLLHQQQASGGFGS